MNLDDSIIKKSEEAKKGDSDDEEEEEEDVESIKSMLNVEAEDIHQASK